jgi:chemotaxis protein methyltransferase WspC
LQEAARLCETYLSQNPVSVEAHVLLGQIYQAVGNQERSQLCFQKAIYLEPDSYEALIHLALLKENRGDIAGANLIRQRIQRLQK